MLVATAGHIDHGKTALVRALTGVETDRLPEEQARGISIDLGFAYWHPDAGRAIGFVDVPGHERFVRNMLAGVSGVQFALLVVAADDGVMPQTAEHLRILHLLGIERGIAVLTKCDRANSNRIAEVRAQIAGLPGGTTLAAAPIFEVSSLTGEGIDTLAAALIAERNQTDLAADDGRGFRMAIDRAFTVSGAGTVVTGTVVAGSLAAGATLTVSPLGREVRVRGMQSGGGIVDCIAAGQRCALNLAGIELGELHRGDWLVEPALHAPTARIAARLRLLGECPARLRHDVQVHLHIGAADLSARVLMPRQRALQPGEEALIQLVLDAPTSAVTGQRFVLRDWSGRVLLGGGSVLDPLASPKRRSQTTRQAAAAALALPSPAEALAALAAIPGFEPDTVWFARCFNLTAPALAALLAGDDLVLVGAQAAIARSRFDRLSNLLVDTIGEHHRLHPEAGGMTRREARLALAEPVSTELLTALLAALGEAERIASGRGLLRLPGHSAAFSAAETAMWREVLGRHEDGPPRPILVADLARELHRSEATIRAMLLRRRTSGDIWQITETRFLLPGHVTALAAIGGQLDSLSSAGFSPAQFRDASGMGRNFVIQLLEFFDRIGVTRRQGEVRRMRTDYEAAVGDAASLATPRVLP